MKIAVVISRVILGLGFTVAGLNTFHPFLPQPLFTDGTLSEAFMNIMISSRWLTLVALFQLFGGLLVLIGRTMPLGLTLLAPVLVNILAFHIFLEQGHGLIPGLVLSALELFLIYSYRNYFKAIFTLNAKPNSK